MTAVVSVMASYLPGGQGSPVSIHGLPALRRIFEELSELGIDVISSQGAEVSKIRDPVVLWDFGSVAVLPRHLKEAANGRMVAWSLESPLVAHRGYHRLPQIGKKAAHVIGFRGVGGLLGDEQTARFHPVGWPSEVRAVDEAGPWDARRWLTLINSNKRLHQWRESFSLSRLRSSLRVAASSLVARSYRLRRQWTVPDLYRTRMEVLTHLSHETDFAFYGAGWMERLPGQSKDAHARLIQRYEGAPADKHEVLRNFKFCLCIENTSFPGYISEKLIDCLFAGTIPVYLGAPDVERYVPPGIFIDMRDFDNYADLVRRLRSVDAEEALEMRRAASEFVRSESFELFTAEHFQRHVVGAIKDTLGRS